MTAVAALAFLLVASACGGADPQTSDDGFGGGDVTTTARSGGSSGTESDLEDAARDMFLAFVSGDHQAYFNYLSRECRDRLQFASVDEHLKGRKLRANQAGIDVSVLGVDEVTVFDFTGSSALVSLTLAGTTEQFEESIANRWIHEDGGWHDDDCDNITPPRGGLEGFGTDRDNPVQYGGVADINGWLMTVSWITPDDEELVVELGGKPAAQPVLQRIRGDHRPWR